MTPEFTEFIESWGSLGVFWGINRSMARVHAFLLLAENPVDLDDVSHSLQISRGNTSMCLKELRQWGVIKRTHIPGDRRDYYVVEPDTWNMLFQIADKRKKGEFDPALQALRTILNDDQTSNNKIAHERLTEIEELFSALDLIIKKCLQSKQLSKALLEVVKKFTSN